MTAERRATGMADAFKVELGGSFLVCKSDIGVTIASTIGMWMAF